MDRLLSARLVGRAEERRELLAAVDAASQRGGAVVLLGEAGIGKSRLLREARQRVHQRGLPLMWGRATAGAGPFGPVQEAVAAGVRALGAPARRELLPVRAVLAQLAGEWTGETRRRPVPARRGRGPPAVPRGGGTGRRCGRRPRGPALGRARDADRRALPARQRRRPRCAVPAVPASRARRGPHHGPQAGGHPGGNGAGARAAGRCRGRRPGAGLPRHRCGARRAAGLRPGTRRRRPVRRRGAARRARAHRWTASGRWWLAPGGAPNAYHGAGHGRGVRGPAPRDPAPPDPAGAAGRRPAGHTDRHFAARSHLRPRRRDRARRPARGGLRPADRR